MRRQRSHNFFTQRVDRGHTQDGWLDITAGEIECAATFKTNLLGSLIAPVHRSRLTVMPLAVDGE